MSKEEAWQEVVEAWGQVHQEYCAGACDCDKKLQEIKVALNV